ncbi:MAG: type III pantothenate kinase [Acidobacteria bacterium]|nr:type III pantothenate kinase [Acidobacteriota bacterium]
MLLAIDIGNTQTQLGVFDTAGELVGEWRLSTHRDRTGDELGISVRNLLALQSIEPAAIGGIIAASVVPPLTAALERMGDRYFGHAPVMVDAGLVDDLPILYEPPEAVGADRIVNAVAAREKHGSPVVVVDFGTATTFDVVDTEGAYLGGVIATGVGVSADALFHRAARLPRVHVAQPEAVIGRNTTASVQAGLFFGYAEMVDGLLARIVDELAAEPRVVATGGWSATIGEACTRVDEIDPLLTLQGLRLIHQRYGRA